MYTLTLEAHLDTFQPRFRNPSAVWEVARWAIDQAKAGQWLSTREWDGDLVTVTHVVEHLKLGVFIPTPDPRAPLD